MYVCANAMISLNLEARRASVCVLGGREPPVKVGWGGGKGGGGGMGGLGIRGLGERERIQVSE